MPTEETVPDPTVEPEPKDVFAADFDHHLVAYKTTFIGNSARFNAEFPDLRAEDFTHFRRIANVKNTALNDYYIIYPEIYKKIILALKAAGKVLAIVTSAELNANQFAALAEAYDFPLAIFDGVVFIDRHSYGVVKINDDQVILECTNYGDLSVLKAEKIAYVRQQGLLPARGKIVFADDDLRNKQGCFDRGIEFIQARACLTFPIWGSRFQAVSNTYLREIISALNLDITLTEEEIATPSIPEELDANSNKFASYLFIKDIQDAIENSDNNLLNVYADKLKNCSPAEKLWHLRPMCERNFLNSRTFAVMDFAEQIEIDFDDFFAYMFNKDLRRRVSNILVSAEFNIIKLIMIWTIRKHLKTKPEQATLASPNIFDFLSKKEVVLFDFINSGIFEKFIEEISYVPKQLELFLNTQIIDSPVVILFLIKNFHIAISQLEFAKAAIKYALERLILKEPVLIMPIIRYLETLIAKKDGMVVGQTIEFELFKYVNELLLKRNPILTIMHDMHQQADGSLTDHVDRAPRDMSEVVVFGGQVAAAEVGGLPTGPHSTGPTF